MFVNSYQAISACLLSTLLCLSLWGWAEYKRIVLLGRNYIIVIFITAPLLPWVNIIRKPIFSKMLAVVKPGAVEWDPGSFWIALPLFGGAFIEEGIKILWVFLFYYLMRRESKTRDYSGLSYAVGLGYGIGEIWMLGQRLVGFRIPDSLAHLGVLALTGFIGERLMAAPSHGFLTGIAAHGLSNNKKIIPLFFLAAVLLHAASNIGVALYQSHKISASGATIWFIVFLLFEMNLFHKMAGLRF